MIEITDFHKTYGETTAVAGLSFVVEPGQVLGLVGPNGAGKTTTLRALCGIIPPTRGRLCVAGHDVAKDPVAAKLALAYVPDDPHLFDSLTVWEHLRFTAKAYGVDGLQTKGPELLERFELTEKRNTAAQELSRGMRQKVAICCAYLHDPRAILFDEPITGLDPRGIRTMKDTVRERAQAGAAVIISSHLLELVEDLCTHLLIIHKGRQLFCGGMAEAHATFAAGGRDASLEDVFFSATEAQSAASRPAIPPETSTPPDATPPPGPGG